MFFFKNTLYILCFTYWAISLKLKVLNYPAIIFSPTPQNVTNLATLLDPFNFNLLFLTSYTKKIVNVLVKHISHIFSFFWFKLTFRGKGFRVRKFHKSEKITFSFGHSHWTKLLLHKPKFSIFKIRRQNYIWVLLHFNSLSSIQKLLRRVKVVNRYTKRGLRLKKQYIRKRFGKISQMISSLHF